ncbi:MAG TPA: hypothetical protein DEB39_07715, partial [Planctomycetaceae bacterium]|nr:hypothetical protein [Planctomycetaceae bacterium]
GADAGQGATVETNLRQIGEVELTLDDNDGPQEVTFEFKPEKIGRTLYVVRAVPIAEESIRENNERQTAALVVEPGMRVLYIEGTLRNEYGAITERFLSKDPDIEFCAMVQTRPNVFSKRSNIEGLEIKGIPDTQELIDRFDVFLVGDIDSSYFKPEIQEMFVKRVRAGAGLIMIGGYHSLGPGGYAGTPIGNILPVVLGDRDIGQFTDAFMPKLTPDGQQSHIFKNIVEFFPGAGGVAPRDGLPMLDGCTNVLASGPGATVLATCPLKLLADQREMPVLAVQPVGEGRSVVFTVDTTRKWQQGPKALDLDSPFMQFWGQMIRYLAGRDTQVLREAGVSAAIDKAYYEPEESMNISATVRNAEGEGTDKAKVTATITSEDGRSSTATLEPIPDAPGKFAVDFEPKTIGRHDVRVEATIDGEVHAAPEKMVLDIGRPNMEFDRLDLNEDLLVKMSDATNGRYAHITTADFLIDQLNREQMKRKVVETINLAPPAWMWITFVVLLSAEWGLRRRYHLR